MTSPSSQDYVPTPQCLFPPTEEPNGVWEQMSVSMLLSNKVVWVCFHHFWLSTAWAVVASSLSQLCFLEILLGSEAVLCPRSTPSEVSLESALKSF